jgi:hypothetical protein
VCSDDRCTPDPTGDRRPRPLRPHAERPGPVACPRYDDGAVLVGPDHLGAGVSQHRQRRRGRVPVGVVGPDADQADRGSERGVELRVLVRRPVVGHLDDLDRSQFARRRGARAQPPLRGLPEVAEEHPADAPRAGWSRLGPEHQAGVVAGLLIADRGPEHPPPHGAERPGGPGVRTPDVGAAPLQGADDAFVGRTPDRSDERRPDPADDDVDGSHVVPVEVGQDEQVDPVDAEQVEARRQAVGIVPGVDEGDRPAGTVADEDRITLPHVARRDGPVRWESPAQDEHRHRRAGDADHHDDPRQQQEPRPDHAGRQDRGGQTGADGDGGAHAAGAARPRQGRERQRGRSVRDAPDRRRRRPGDPGEHRAPPRPHRRGQACCKSHDGDDRSEWLGEQVRGDRVGRQRRRQRDGERPAGDLRGHGDRHRRGDRGPEPSAEEDGERRREDHDPRRREHREPERERAGVPGVDDEHAHDREGDERDAADRSPGQVDDQDDHGHHRCPHDRRIRPDQHHERQQEGDGDGDAGASRQSDRTAEHDDEPDDHRAVRAGDRREVRERGDLHRRLRGGVEAAPVPDGQPTEQGATGLGQLRRHRGERTPSTVGRREQAAGRVGGHGTPKEDHRGGGGAGVVGLDHRARGQSGPRGPRGSAVGDSGHHPHRHPESTDAAAVHEGPEHGPVRRGEIAVEDDLHRRRPACGVGHGRW